MEAIMRKMSAVLLIAAIAVMGFSTARAGDEEVFEQMRSIITQAFMGVGEDEETTIYLGNNADGSFMALVFVSPDATESMAFFGEASRDGETVTLLDDGSGESIEITIFDVGESHMVLSIFDMEFAVAPTEVDELIEALVVIDEETSTVN